MTQVLRNQKFQVLLGLSRLVLAPLYGVTVPVYYRIVLYKGVSNALAVCVLWLLQDSFSFFHVQLYVLTS